MLTRMTRDDATVGVEAREEASQGGNSHSAFRAARTKCRGLATVEVTPVAGKVRCQTEPVAAEGVGDQ